MKAFALLGLIALAGCASTGQPFSGLSESDGSRVVVYHVDSMSPYVTVGNSTSCAMKSGSYRVVPVQSGEVTISAKYLDTSSESAVFGVAPGRDTFVRISTNQTKNEIGAASGAFGLAGGLAAAAATSGMENFYFAQMPKEIALNELRRTKEAVCK